MDNIAIAELKSQEQVMSTITINGIPQGGQKVKQYFIQCSNCSRVLGQFNPGDPLIGVIEACKNQASKDMIYCPTCGCKLSWTMDILDSNEIVEEDD